MVELLNSEAIRSQVHPITVSAYHRLGELGEVDERVELIDGVIVDKMSKSPLHTYVVRTLNRLLQSWAGQREFWVQKEDPLTLASSEPEPDLSVIAGPEPDLSGVHPYCAALVVEVAISSLPIDRLKADIYAAADIPEYWIVCPEQKHVEVYRQPENGSYADIQTVGFHETLHSSALEGFSLPLSELTPKS